MGFRLVLAPGHVGILDHPSTKAAPTGNAPMTQPRAALGIRKLAA